MSLEERRRKKENERRNKSRLEREATKNTLSCQYSQWATDKLFSYWAIPIEAIDSIFLWADIDKILEILGVKTKPSDNFGCHDLRKFVMLIGKRKWTILDIYLAKTLSKSVKFK